MKQIYQQLKIAITALLFFLIPAITFGQTKISGIVTDENKLPLPGVNVTIKGGQKGTVTDIDGRFEVKANSDQTLVFSFIGYDKKEILVSSQTVINVSMQGGAKALNEVVVTALNVKKDVKRIGYATQTVDGDALTTARDPNPITGLAGKVAGLSVGASAELLGTPNVLIRGDAVTLYVVDGFPINTDTFNISPDDIESYTVLKGPAAAALYGSRALNGAILITTKKGNKNKKGFTVDLNSSTIINKGFLAFPRVQHSYGPGENEFYEFVDGKGGAPGGVDSDYDIWGPYFAGQLIPQFDSPVVNGVRTATPWTARGANNLANFLQTGYQTNNEVALSAVGDTYNIRFSASQQHQQSYIPDNYLDIANANLYASFHPIDSRFTIEANIDFNRQTTDQFPDVTYGPNSLIYDLAIWTGADWSVNQPIIKAVWQPGKVGVQSEFEEYTRYHNPWFMVEDWKRGHYKNDTYGYLSGNFKIDNNLNVTLRSAIDTYNILRTEDLPYSAHPYGREGNMGDYREDRRDLFDNNTELLLNYNYTIKKFVNLSGLVGGNLRNFSYNSSWVSTDYLSVPGVYSFNNSLNPLQATSFNSQMRVLSAFYSLDATFGNFLTISSTGRVDKSSAFQTPTTYYYPSLSAASVISDYVKLPDFISFLKVRASYSNVRSDETSPTVGPAPFSSITAFGGSTGPSLYDNPLGYGSTYLSPYNGPNYSLNPAYNQGKPYNNQPAGYNTNNLYQTGLVTSTRVNYEEGFDIKFLKNRIGLSATAFQYIDGPEVLANTISTATGYNIEYTNALKTKKTGYEASLTGTPVKSNDFTWNAMVNVSTYKQVFDELPAGQTLYPYNNGYFTKGERIDNFYGTAFVRNKQGQIVNGSNGEPLVNPVDQFLGHLNADYQWSIYNSFRYKQITLGFQFDGSVGGVMVDYMHKKTMVGGANLETAEGALGAARYQDWVNFGKKGYNGSYVGPGVVISNGVAPNYDSKTGAILNYNQLQFAPNTQTAFVQEYVSQYYNTDEANLMSKTYAKLREVTIAYAFPKEWLAHTFIQNASASLFGRNLLYFYKDARFKDVDLDQYNSPQATSVLQSPTVRSYGLDLKLSF
ncbi:TonB-linked outer membrane protein, SusC/RagA family [Mucilaginibacter mallensis]|uniref:TonB-linked outer membrane protein, SusC/RagA family n=1 Tax=Mucilaginibacter mallensis TaxID=652787 RepID=A0A1H1YEJ7_MUCMA|nr:SusC/RagA family TonB-linked outer membrane protein [Mucilaginibacter mallensis]SDT19948.1 TonB-linked outer membrane protein, SusC/RagA family [Mucilaginibacter mallensis]